MIGDGDDFQALLGYTARVNAKEGFFMADNLPPAPRRGRASFRQIADSFLSQPGLPFAEILSGGAGPSGSSPNTLGRLVRIVFTAPR